MAAGPIVFPLVAIGVAYVVDAITGAGADVAWYLLFVLVAGSGFVIPGIGVTLVGAALLPRRAGTVTTVIGLLLQVAAAALLTVGVFGDTLDAVDGQPRMVARLSIAEAVAFAVPYALVIVGSIYVAYRVIAAARHRCEMPAPIAAG
ncbi:hypothetical protein ACFWU5_13875 [Nocardia sp. NPDC058640]|uniref:hypothetical protein n=1 Tax=Nocardia sp. NPDC058640 TaxID=3346571 RepID=UPI00364E63B1